MDKNFRGRLFRPQYRPKDEKRRSVPRCNRGGSTAKTMVKSQEMR